MGELARRDVGVPAKKVAAKRATKKVLKKAPAKKAAAKKATAKKATAKKAPAKKATAKKATANKATAKKATANKATPGHAQTGSSPGPAMALPAPPTDPLAVLGLAESHSAAQLRRAWRQFAARHHPDQGGDAVTFTRGRSAYESLLRRDGRLRDA